MTAPTTTRPVIGPGAGVLSIPPSSIPLSYLATAGVGLTAFGIAVMLVADDIVTWAMLPHVTATAHLEMLAFLTMAVVGALHQFGPVVGQRPLRSNTVARATFVGLVATVILLPLGFARGPENLIPIGGLIGAATVCAIAWNLSGPLGRHASGVPVWGLRLSVTLLVATVGFGVTYAFNRQTGWFPLYPHRLLAHVHLGVFGWLGLTYASVAEKLWPMFLLSHRPRARSGVVAISGLSSGAVLLALGLVLDVRPITILGAIGVAIGVGGHLTSLVGAVRHRRRRLELLHIALFVSSAFLITGVLLGVIAGLADVDPLTRARLVTAEIGSLMAWLSIAIVGHVHKIVPFIGFTSLREQGVTRGPDGKPLLFGHLFHARAAAVAVTLTSIGFAAAVLGVLTTTAWLVSVGGAAIAASAVVASSNLAIGPYKVRRAFADAAARDQPNPPKP